MGLGEFLLTSSIGGGADGIVQNKLQGLEEGRINSQKLASSSIFRVRFRIAFLSVFQVVLLYWVCNTRSN